MLEGSICLQGKTPWLSQCEFVYRIRAPRAIDKAYELGNKSSGSWSLSKPPGITDAHLTSKTWGPQPRSDRIGIHKGLILHTPWQMQMGTYETWGISLTDRAAGNKNGGGIAHWLSSVILKQSNEPEAPSYKKPFKYHFRARAKRKAYGTTPINTGLNTQKPKWSIRAFDFAEHYLYLRSQWKMTKAGRLRASKREDGKEGQYFRRMDIGLSHQCRREMRTSTTGLTVKAGWWPDGDGPSDSGRMPSHCSVTLRPGARGRGAGNGFEWSIYSCSRRWTVAPCSVTCCWLSFSVTS